MGLFGFGKKKAEAPACACQCGCPTSQVEPGQVEVPTGEGLNLKVLGTGCTSCHTLLENTQQAVARIGTEAQVEYVQDMAQIAAYGVMSVPALVVNGKVVSTGKVLKTDEVEQLLHKLGF